jgi:glycosyltransferase involved in cell wall biosynthesis
MHAGLVIYGRLDTLSGGYLYDRQLVTYLRAAGDTVTIISLPWTNYGRHLLHNWSPDLRQSLRNGRFDVLLQDELNHPSLFALNRRRQGAVSYPLVSIVHHLRSSERHPAWQMPLYRRVERAYLRSVDGFIFNSETTRTAVAELTGQSAPHVVAYPAANHQDVTWNKERRQAETQREGPLRVLFVGNIIPRKGLHVLLAALALLPAASWQLAIVGDPRVDAAYAGRMRDAVVSAGLEKHVSWHGRLADHALAEQFAANDLLVVPSSYEGFGIVYLEAMAYGLPVIATTAGAAGETVVDGVNGFLVPPDDVSALAQHIRLLHEDRARLWSMSSAARESYTAAPTWAENMAAAREFLLRISTQ